MEADEAMRIFTVFLILAVLASCGGTSGPRPGRVVSISASGPMSRACMASDRKARSDALCGCVQAMANRHLSASEQSRATKFWRDPQRVQDMRQSDNPRNEAFWAKWKAFGADVEQTCKQVA